MSEYDPFNLPEPTLEQTRAKHYLNFNGLWLFVDYPFLNEKCLCGCIASWHLSGIDGKLDNDSICLNSRCICQGFIKKGGARVTKTEGKPPRKVLTSEVQEGLRLNSYVQTMSQL